MKKKSKKTERKIPPIEAMIEDILGPEKKGLLEAGIKKGAEDWAALIKGGASVSFAIGYEGIQFKITIGPKEDEA